MNVSQSRDISRSLKLMRASRTGSPVLTSLNVKSLSLSLELELVWSSVIDKHCAVTQCMQVPLSLSWMSTGNNFGRPEESIHVNCLTGYLARFFWSAIDLSSSSPRFIFLFLFLLPSPTHPLTLIHSRLLNEQPSNIILIANCQLKTHQDCDHEEQNHGRRYLSSLSINSLSLKTWVYRKPSISPFTFRLSHCAKTHPHSQTTGYFSSLRSPMPHQIRQKTLLLAHDLLFEVMLLFFEVPCAIPPLVLLPVRI